MVMFDVEDATGLSRGVFTMAAIKIQNPNLQDATGLSRGVFTMAANKIKTPNYKMPRACPVEFSR